MKASTIVRIRIIAPEGCRIPYRQVVDDALSNGEWRYPDYCYLSVPTTAVAKPLDIPDSATVGGRNRTFAH